jgi:hypothetical protein
MVFHSWMIVFLDFRIRENDGRRCAIAFKPIPLRWVGLPFFSDQHA